MRSRAHAGVMPSGRMHALVRRLMAAMGGLQGLALWLLYEGWPDSRHDATTFVALVFFVVVSAVVGHMTRTGTHQRRLWALAAGTGVAFALVAFWVAWQLPVGEAPFSGDARRLSTWVVAGGIALFAMGPFLQIHQATGGLRFPYSELYRHSWNNLFTAALGALYAGALWVVLVLWAQLFGLIGVTVFVDLFSEPSFIFGVSGAALGYGLAAAREGERVIATLRGLTEALFRAVLPILACVSIGFIATLLFTGLEPLFATRRAAAILIAWLGAQVLFLNAVYLDGSVSPPYSRWIRRVVEAGVAATPVMAIIALHAVQLRIGQYGLTPDRVFATVCAVILGLYSVGYAAAVLLRGEPWLPRVRTVNVAMAWVVSSE